MEDEIPLHTLQFMERHFFHEYDDAYRRYYQDDLPVYDEVVAYEQALDAVTKLRKQREEEQDVAMEETANLVADALDDIE